MAGASNKVDAALGVERDRVIDELGAYILEHVETIFVRVHVDGRWQSLSLAEMPAPHALEAAFRFMREGRIPTRVLREAPADG